MMKITGRCYNRAMGLSKQYLIFLIFTFVSVSIQAKNNSPKKTFENQSWRCAGAINMNGPLEFEANSDKVRSLGLGYSTLAHYLIQDDGSYLKCPVDRNTQITDSTINLQVAGRSIGRVGNGSAQYSVNCNVLSSLNESDKDAIKESMYAFGFIYHLGKLDKQMNDQSGIGGRDALAQAIPPISEVNSCKELLNDTHKQTVGAALATVLSAFSALNGSYRQDGDRITVLPSDRAQTFTGSVAEIDCSKPNTSLLIECSNETPTRLLRSGGGGLSGN